MVTYRILLSGGGTAGSVTPLLALVEHIRQQRHDVEFLFLGSATGPEQVLVKAAQIPFSSIPSGKLRRYLSFKNFSDLVQIWRGYQQAKRILQSWPAQVAVTAGSFVSVPVIWAAHRQGIPTLIHQQDVRPGLANRLMASAATKITLAFASSATAFHGHNILWIGNPVRPEILNGDPGQAREIFHLPRTYPVLLVLGGGTGSRSINSVLGAMVKTLTANWSVIHVTGQERENTNFQHQRYQQYSFLTWQLPHALAVADVVVSRAGLGAMSELAALGKAAIFIPLPTSHQVDNARAVAEASAGIVLDEELSIESRLGEAIEKLRLNSTERQRLGNNLRQFYQPQALSLFVDQVLHLMEAGKT